MIVSEGAGQSVYTGEQVTPAVAVYYGEKNAVSAAKKDKEKAVLKRNIKKTERGGILREKNASSLLKRIYFESFIRLIRRVGGISALQFLHTALDGVP